ncbi:2994_t:CDS:2 [Racocetra fulgida]|uniref:Peroxidase n=1 Tax=Racocetra fulgida TaxID=60492 RepID=A0A9N9GEP8_9GLOM|nr:2994_t:CDS:2 [Racocetra fulgida]
MTPLSTVSVSFRNRIFPSARSYTTQTPEKKGGSSALLWIGAGLIAAGAGYYYFVYPEAGVKTLVPTNKEPDYQKIYNQIADILEDNDWDDGSWGPVLLRLAWHASGTYDKNTKTGGSNGATMRFSPESDHDANAGLKAAREKLENIKKNNPEITYSDLWTLAGVVAIQEMVNSEAAACTPDGRLPDASKGPSHIRDIFYRMGFDDRPILFTNGYYQELLGKKWVEKKWKGPKQFIDKETGILEFLLIILINEDKAFKQYVEQYAKDEALFFKDFAAAFHKLEELGVPRTGDEKVYYFKTKE